MLLFLVYNLYYFFNDYIPIADRWILADNSEIPFKVIAEGRKEGMIIKDSATYDIIKAASDAGIPEVSK